MNNSLLERARRFLQARRKRNVWHKALSTLAVIVVFVTTYMLILPALTLEQDSADFVQDEFISVSSESSPFTDGVSADLFSDASSEEQEPAADNVTENVPSTIALFDSKAPSCGDATSYVWEQGMSLSWCASVSLAEQFWNQDITIRETLPAGVDIDALSLTAGEQKIVLEDNGDGTYTCALEGAKAVRESGTSYAVSVPAAANAAGEISVETTAFIPEDYEWNAANEEVQYADFVAAVHVYAGGVEVGSASQTQTVTKSVPQPSPELEPSVMPEVSVTPAASVTPKASVTPTPVPSEIPTPIPSVTETPEPSETPDLTVTPSVTITPEPSETPGLTVTPSVTITPEPSETPGLTVTPSVTITPEPSETPGLTVTPSVTETPEPSETPDLTPTPSVTITPIPEVTPVPDNGAETFLTEVVNDIAPLNEDGITDFGVYITSATVQKIINGQWTTSQNFESGDQVRATLAYKLPAGIITESNRVITYQLPEGVVPNENLSGTVYSKGSAVGSYTISQDGLITITFDQEFATGNEIEGDIYFEGTVTSSDTSVDKTIEFGGSSSSITINKEKEEETPTDINVEKTAAVSENKETIDYTVTIGTTLGTGDVITFDDYLTHGTYQTDTIKVTKVSADGTKQELSKESYTVTTESVEWTADQQHMNITGLPKLETGETYLVTYTAQAGDANDDGSNTVTNSAGANGKWVFHEEIISEAKIRKDGSYNSDTGKITWKVSINSGGENLNGFVLSDVMGDEPLPDKYTATLTTPSGESKQITLPYTFGDTTENYTCVIEYVTDAPSDGTATIHNDAILTKDDESYTSGKDIFVANRDWNIGKSNSSGEGVATSDGNREYTWTSNITLPNKTFAHLNSFTYTDEILGGADSHYGTVSEITAKIAETLELQYIQGSGNITVPADQFTNYFGYTIKYYNGDNEVSVGTDKVTRFEITFTAEEEKAQLVGKYIKFQYPTIGVVPADSPEGTTFEFQNKGSIPDHEITAKATYTKPVRLWKASSASGSLVPPEDSYYTSPGAWFEGFKNGGSTVELGEGGYLYYRLVLNPESTNEIIINDVLPEGTSYVENSGYALFCATTWDDSGIQGLWRIDNGYDLAAEENKATFAISGQDLTITIPGGYPQGVKIAVFYAVKVDEAMLEGTGTAAFNNKASWNGSNASTTTTVKKTKSIISKTGEQCTTIDDKGNTINLNEVEYNIVINPDSENLDVSNDVLTLYDNLTSQNIPDVYLNLDTVKLYTYEADAVDTHYRGELIDSSRFQIAYENIGVSEKRLTVRLPDELACVLTYHYQYDRGSAGDIDLNNEAVLMGQSSKEDELVLKDNTSGANAGQGQVKIYKVDSEDYSKLLPETSFKLYSYREANYSDNSSEGWWEHTGVDLKTNEKGEITFKGGDNTTADTIEKDVVYKLVETEAPSGYGLSAQPYYFVWLEEKTLEQCWNEISWNMQQEIGSKEKIQALGKTGGAVYIPNKYTSVGVKKVWLDDKGVAVTPGTDHIQVQLMKNTRTLDGYEVTVEFYSGNSLVDGLTKKLIVKKIPILLLRYNAIGVMVKKIFGQCKKMDYLLVQ